MWYWPLSPHCACIRSLGIILIHEATLVSSFVSVSTSVAELAHSEKSHIHPLNQSITHVIWCNGDQSFRFRMISFSQFICITSKDLRRNHDIITPPFPVSLLIQWQNVQNVSLHKSSQQIKSLITTILLYTKSSELHFAASSTTECGSVLTASRNDVTCALAG